MTDDKPRRRAVSAWEEVAMSIVDSLAHHEISPELARDWLRMILNYAEAQ